MKIRRIHKRDGREVPFDKTKISDAVARAQAAVGESDPLFATEVAAVVELALERRFASDGERAGDALPGIEDIQDLVEQALIELGQAAVAKAYILYRDRRARIRAVLQVRGEDRADARPRRSATRPASEAEERAASAAQDRCASSTGTPAESTARECADELGVAIGAARSKPRHPARAPRVHEASGIVNWSKGRIVVALMNEADLPRSTAEQVAARVEERVFDSGLRRISTALIRELVDNELVDLGLAQALRRQRPVGLPRHDLRRILADPSSIAREALAARRAGAREAIEPRGVEDAIAGEILRRYTLEDVLPEALAEMHLAGELMLMDVARPHLHLVQALPCELAMRGKPGPASAFELLDEIARLASGVAYGVVLEDCAPLVQGLVRGTRAGIRDPSARPPAQAVRASGPLAHWLCALAALARTSGRHLDLALSSGAIGPRPSASARAQPARETALSHARASPVAHAPTWLVRLLEELVLLENDQASSLLPRLFLDGDELSSMLAETPSARRAVQRLFTSGRLIPTFGVASERFAGPGLQRGLRERGALACGGAVALNLPRVARRAGPWREDALLEGLARQVECALDALSALQTFQRAERNRRGSPGGVRGRVGYALSPVGLREALRWLGDGELRPEQGTRLLAFLTEAAERFGRARGLDVVITPYFGEQACARFAALDLELFQVSQPLLFEPGSRLEHARGSPYSCGFDLGSCEPGFSPFAPAAWSGGSALGAGEAALLAAQRSGAVHPPEVLSSLAAALADEEFPAVSAWERLERMRSRLRAGAHALYALPKQTAASEGLDAEAKELAPTGGLYEEDEELIPARGLDKKAGRENSRGTVAGADAGLVLKCGADAADEGIAEQNLGADSCA